MSLPDDFIKMLADEPVPPPSAERRADTLLKANIAFREKMQAKAQRPSLIRRLLGIGPHTPESRMKMRTLMGGTALGLVAILSVSVGMDYLRYSTRTTTGDAQFQSIGAVTSPSPASLLSDMIDNSTAASTPVMPTGDQPMRQRLEQAEREGTESDELAAVSEPQSIAPQPMQEGTVDKGVYDGRSNSVAAPTAAPVPAEAPGLTGQLRDAESVVAGSRGDRAQGAGISAEEYRRMVAPAPGVPTSPPVHDYIQPMPKPSVLGSDTFANLPDSPLQDVTKSPVSTFSADVDTASYSTVRRMLQAGQMPPADAVRTEEMVNYFNYNYPLPESRNQPFAPTVTVFENPWNKGTQLVHVGIKAFDLPAEARPPVNLVLLIDVSGSMNSPDKLPLVKSSFAMLIDELKPTDTVSIVTYAGHSGVALEPTKVSEREKILGVINSLGAGGSTAGAEGLRTAYELARQNYNKEGVNRILLATDGDFNVGVSEPGGLAQYVAGQRSSGVFLSVLGYGMGNYQDTTMQAIAQNGNGVAAYIDGMGEARRVLREQMTSTMFTVAKDVKFQVEFNPMHVQSYRLLGYETRALRREDFNNDRVDAGEVGAGSEVTAIYEIVPVGAAPATDSLRYGIQSPEATRGIPSRTGEIGHLRIRYKLPDSDTSTLIERPIVNGDRTELTSASADVRFATAVAGFSRLLRNSAGVSGFGYADVIKLAESARGEDVSGERVGFIDLVRTAQSLSGSQPVPAENGGVAFPPPPR